MPASVPYVTDGAGHGEGLRCQAILQRDDWQAVIREFASHGDAA